MPPKPDEGEDQVKWYQIQEKVFTRWVNDYLSQRDLSISSLKNDFHSGLMLITLMEILSGRPVGRYNKKPRLEFHRLENITLALNFIKKEGIPLVNIGTDDIYEGNIRIILGLIWLLILRYEIKAGNQEDDGSSNDLLQWIRSKIPEYDIKNFTSNWNDGRAICALVNAVAPGVIPDHWQKDPKNALENATEGIFKADEYLKVDKLILPDEMVHPKVDKLGMMTYLAQFRNIKPEDIKRPQGAADFRAWGEGLQTGTNGEQSKFWVDGPANLKATKNLQVTAKGPNGPVPVNVVTNSNGELECTYTPNSAGVYEIPITYENSNIPGSVFKAVVKSGASRCRAYGDGLVTGIAGKESQFWVDVPKDLKDKLEIRVEGPKDDAVCTVGKNAKGEYDVKYTPTTPGKYRIHVTLGGEHIPGSIFELEVLPPATACRAYGPGLERAVAGEDAPFAIDVPKWVKDPVKVTIDGPQTPQMDMKQGDDGNYKVVYKPTVPGMYHVNVTVGGHHVPGSTFHVQAVAPAASQCKAYGPGLISGIAEQPANFVVEIPAAIRPQVEDKLAIKVEGPKDNAPVKVVKNASGNFDVEYLPTTPGQYKVHVTVASHHIPGSIFYVNIASLASQCRAYGPGLEKGIAGVKAPFTVEVPEKIRKSVRGKLAIEVVAPNGRAEPAEAVENKSTGNYDVVYTPTMEGIYTVGVLVDKEHVPQSAFKVPIAHPADFVRAYGEGLERGMAGKPAPFNVDIPAELQPLLKGKIDISVQGPEGDKPAAEVTQGNNGNLAVAYVPKHPGKYNITITGDKKGVPGSVFTATITEPDAARCRAYGDGLVEATAEEHAHFTLETPDTVKPKDIAIPITGPKGQLGCTIVKSDRTKDKTLIYDCKYLPMVPGEYKIPITVEGYHVPGSVFQITVLPPPVRGKCRVYYSTTSGDMKVKADTDRIEFLLFAHKQHLRPDFEPWHAVDMMDKPDREAIFEEAGTRKLPILFIDDVYVGDRDTIEELNDSGEFAKMLAMHTVKLLTLDQHMARLLGYGEEDFPVGGPRTHFCGTCGYTKLKDNKYCPECGSENPVPFSREKLAAKLRFHNVPQVEPESRTVGKLPGLGGAAGAGGAGAAGAAKKKKETPAERRARLPKLRPDQIDKDSFFLACYHGDLDKVEAMLIAGADPNQLDQDGNTPWIAALENKQSHVGSVLVEYGAHFEIDDLFIAIDDGHIDLVEAMIKRGVDVNVTDEEGTSPLSLAIASENGQIARMLRRHGATVNPPKRGVKEFFAAVEAGNYEEVQRLVDTAHVDVNSVNADGKSGLDIATKKGDKNLIKYLTLRGGKSGNKDAPAPAQQATFRAPASPPATFKAPVVAKQSVPNSEEVFVAVAEGNIEEVKKLLAAGADVHAKDEEGNSLVTVAEECGHKDIATLLRQKGAR